MLSPVFRLVQLEKHRLRQHRLKRDHLLPRLIESEAQLVVMEATGGLELLVALALHGEGIACVWLNPRLMRHYARSLGKEAKTDAIDVQVLAHYAAER